IWRKEIFNDNREKKRKNQKNKLRTYCTFKIKYEKESYLENIKNIEQRRALTKFRLSAHNLHIESGRYTNTAPEKRTCFHCSKEIENEKHMLLECPLYNTERNDLLKIIKKNININDPNLFIIL
ncbi:hypothetical protein, partial [Acinetobacter baumannii]|uniref:hypothetical protein n=1 Tax=Acinetobacter baumannii TaxID=470 RepID=UPI001C06D903